MPNESTNSRMYLRQMIALYQALPRKNEKAISISELLEKDAIQLLYGRDTDSVEALRKKLIRHLDQLAEYFEDDLVKDTTSNKNTYYLKSSASLEDLNVNTAMLLILAESFLKLTAPKELLADSQSLFENAHAKLDNKAMLNNWRKRLYFSLDKNLQYPVAEDVEMTIYQALKNDSPLRLTYHSQKHDEARHYEGYPVKLMITPYERLLILENPKYNDTQTFLLHRIQRAEIIEGVRVPDRVKIDLEDVEEDIERHTQALLYQEPMDITLFVATEFRYMIEDNPLFFKYLRKPKMTEDGYQAYPMKQVYITMSILDFLVANAKTVWVSEPKWLQDDIINRLKQGIKNYGIRKN